jgi:hypothetical protein
MNELKKNIISMYNDEGKEWLDSLPDINAKIANQHNLSALTPVNNRTFNYVASGYQNNNPTRHGEASGVARVILKIGMNSTALAKEA